MEYQTDTLVISGDRGGRGVLASCWHRMANLETISH